MQRPAVDRRLAGAAASSVHQLCCCTAASRAVVPQGAAVLQWCGQQAALQTQLGAAAGTLLIALATASCSAAAEHLLLNCCRCRRPSQPPWASSAQQDVLQGWWQLQRSSWGALANGYGAVIGPVIVTHYLPEGAAAHCHSKCGRSHRSTSGGTCSLGLRIIPASRCSSRGGCS